VIIQAVRLNGFRNYGDFSQRFGDGINVITGRNAQGKTNLLEAVCYLAAGRSFRARTDRELIGFDREEASLAAEVLTHGREQTLEARLSRARRRALYCNGVKMKSYAEFSGRLASVLFAPDDLDLIFGGAARRRRLMDGALCQLRPKYAAALSEFNRVHEHKTRILRDYGEKPALLDALDEFNHGLAAAGAELIYYRASYVRLLSEKARLVHGDFSNGAERLQVTYKTVSTLPADGAPPRELFPALLARLQALRAAELDSGQCLTGPQKDDLEIMINGRPAKEFASQGQARTAAVSLKLAERDIFSVSLGEQPVLLLDDVLSELDESRQRFLLERAAGGQVFITCCEPDKIASRTRGTVTRIEGGSAVSCTST
jgi:DNA replication and repair protein RecF